MHRSSVFSFVVSCGIRESVNPSIPYRFCLSRTNGQPPRSTLMKCPLSESGAMNVPRYGGVHVPANDMRPANELPLSLPLIVTGPPAGIVSPPHPIDALLATV